MKKQKQQPAKGKRMTYAEAVQKLKRGKKK
jgi:hypothetical protein